jgi:hypothetical protein
VIQILSKLENQALARNSATYFLNFGFLDNQQTPVAGPFNIGHKGQTPTKK